MMMTGVEILKYRRFEGVLILNVTFLFVLVPETASVWKWEFGTQIPYYMSGHFGCSGFTLSIAGVQSTSTSNRDWRGWCLHVLKPHPESHQIEIFGWWFHCFWSQCCKIITSRPLGLILPTCGTNAVRSSERDYSDCLCRLVEPTPQSFQIGSFGTSVPEFWKPVININKT